MPRLIGIALVIAIILKTFVVQAFYIPSGSMEPGLQVGDRVIVNKLVYRLHPPRRGDIIVFARDEDRPRGVVQRVRSVLFSGLGVTRPGHVDFIKRVIALPGETIEIASGEVTITTGAGEKLVLDESYAVDDPDGEFGPFVVPAGTLFVMGDNRPSSSDSRADLGTIAISDVVGRAALRVWPPSRLSFLRRPPYPATPQAMLPVG